ncbi:MAG: zinc-dependent metalloprotease [Elusimicrobia bacterium]|nr:zinc-dependent metalloprotease [Elusimicrobiota bacterium]
MPLRANLFRKFLATSLSLTLVLVSPSLEIASRLFAASISPIPGRSSFNFTVWVPTLQNFFNILDADRFGGRQIKGINIHSFVVPLSRLNLSSPEAQRVIAPVLTHLEETLKKKPESFWKESKQRQEELFGAAVADVARRTNARIGRLLRKVQRNQLGIEELSRVSRHLEEAIQFDRFYLDEKMRGRVAVASDMAREKLSRMRGEQVAQSVSETAASLGGPVVDDVVPGSDSSPGSLNPTQASPPQASPRISDPGTPVLLDVDPIIPALKFSGKSSFPAAFLGSVRRFSPAALAVLSIALALPGAPHFLAGIPTSGWLSLIGMTMGAWAGGQLGKELQDRFSLGLKAHTASVLISSTLLGMSVGISSALISTWIGSAIVTATLAIGVHLSRYDVQFGRLVANSGETPFLKVRFSGEKYYLELDPSQLNRDLFFRMDVVKGIAEKEIRPLENAGQAIVYFERVGDMIRLVEKNLNFQAPPGSPMEKAIKDSVPSSTLSNGKIVREDKSSGRVVVELDKLFSVDIPNLQSLLERGFEAEYKLNSDQSKVSQVKVYPANLETDIRLTFSGKTEQPNHLLPDPQARNIEVVVHYTLAALPIDDFRSRRADDRIGFFETSYQALGNNEKPVDDSLVRNIARWSLKKRDPRAGLSPVVKPIVFWLDRSIPQEYREIVTRGVLAWNQAFEALGYQDAIEVRLAPKSMNYGDIRYNVIRWDVISDERIYAWGGVNTHTLTGEILKADILIPAQHVMVAGNMFDMTHHYDNPFQGLQDARSSRHGCGYAEEAANEAAFVLSLLDSQGKGLSAQERKRFVEEYLLNIVMHETGHTLGLGHNFKAGGWRSVEEVENEKEGMASASVMDYSSSILAPAGKKQGPYWQIKLGPYDFHAIAYGYAPTEGMTPQQERETLDKMASQVGEPGLDYLGDGDMEMDPHATHFYLGRDGLEFARKRVALVRDLWRWMEKKELPQGTDFQTFRRKYLFGIKEYLRALLLARKYIGGMYISRHKAGDPGGRPPLESIPAAKQREAMKFLKELVFSDDPFRLSPDLLEKLSAQRITTLQDPEPETIYKPHSGYVLKLRQVVLDYLFDPEVLTRLVTTEHLVSEGHDRLSLTEVFNEMTQSIWSEIFVNGPKKKVRTISPMRRELQYEYFSRLARYGFGKAARSVSDAGSISQRELVSIKKRATYVLKVYKWDAPSKAHIERIKGLIQILLDNNDNFIWLEPDDPD